MKTTKLSKLPYKGTSDSYPEDMYYQNYLFQTWRKVAKNFGYEEYDTPLIEEASLYKAKSGEELANNQLYSFTDKGEREIAIRPEMTPSLARIVAAKRKELTLPLRWFNIGKYYRYEKPQRGRTREFVQLNIDILGVDSILSEFEIIQYAIAVMEQLNAPKDTYELKVSNRYLLEYLFEKILKLKDSQKIPTLKAIDNYLKINSDEFNDYLIDIGLTQEQAQKLDEFLKWDIDDLKKIEAECKGAKQLLELFERIQEVGLQNVKFCPYIVRGLDYYTGTVFEMYDVGSKENIRALFGGGRYDNLLEIFQEENIPACGLGWGDVTTLDYLKTYNLLPEYKTDIKVFVTLMDNNLYKESYQIVKFLRDNNIATQMQLTPTKLTKQLKYANKKGIPWVIIVGEDEKTQNKVLLKNMLHSEQIKLPLEQVLSKIN